MKKVLCVCVLFLFVFSSVSFALSIDDFKLMTEEYPPFNFQKNGKLQGISVDTLVLMLKKLGAKKGRKDIQLVPWARGYKEIQDKSRISLFAMTRTSAREKMFKWVGPVADSNTSLVARKDRHIKINSIKDLTKYQIGVIREDVGEQRLLEKGIPKANLQESAKPDSIVKKLELKRVDMWAYDEITAYYLIKDAGYNPSDYESVFVVETGQLYFAFSKDTPDDFIAKLQKTLDELKADGSYQKVLDTYSK